jgi:hypothetical protein
LSGCSVCNIHLLSPLSVEVKYATVASMSKFLVIKVLGGGVRPTKDSSSYYVMMIGDHQVAVIWGHLLQCIKQACAAKLT